MVKMSEIPTRKARTRYSGISVYGRASKTKMVSVRPYIRKIRRMTKATPKRKPYLRTVKKIQVKGYSRKTYTKPRSTRFTIWGNIEDLAKAKLKIESENRVPKRQFEDRLSAEEFLKNPDAYSDVGQWTDEKIKES